MPRFPLRFVVLALLALGALLGRAAHAEDGVTVQLSAGLEISAAGDGRARIEIVFGAPMYAAVKARHPDPRKFLQDLAPDRANYEMAEPTARYDDAKASVVLEMVERGAAKSVGGGRWETEAEPTATLVGISPGGLVARPKASFTVEGDWGNGVHYAGRYVCSPPAGAKDVSWDAASRVLSWRLDAPASTGSPRISADFRARDRVMSTIYKVYGLGSDLQAFWLAKTVFRNDGQGIARNLKVRYRLQGYGDWSPWEKHPEVVPGQTIVSVHYPVLDASIARIRTNTPANVLLEYTYEDETGRKIEDDAAKKLVILGVNEFVFGNLTAGASFGSWQEDYNNAPLLAAWVSRNDGAVKQFAAMANRVSGGVGASSDDASALKVLKACYELLQANDFTYQHPPALTDQSVSFDPKRVQNVKFPRETIRDRSGTCIDLAILYAAMANAVGLEAHLALVPGHCFPVIRLPSGRLAGVEITGIQGGRRTGSAAFERVQPYADDEYRKAQADGRIYELDVRALWTRGISNPEMDELPPDILERWGISEEGRPGPRTPPTEAPVPAAVGPDGAVGLWGGALNHPIEGGVLDSFVVGIDKSGDGYDAVTRADVTLAKDGKESKVVVLTRYTGAARDGGVLFQSTERTRTVDGGAPVALVQAFMRVNPKAGGIEARVGNDDEGYTDFTLVPKKDETASTPEAADLPAVRGTWGGEMPHAKLSEKVILDELYVDVPAAGPLSASVRMEFTVLVDGSKVPVTIRVAYADGRVDGDAVRFEKVPWKRTVKATGKQDDLDGNPLVLRVTSDGRLSGTFEGDDGWPFTIFRRGAAPAKSTPSPATPARTTAFDGVVGKWGGDLHLAIDDGVVESLVVGIDKAADGTFTAGSRGVYTVVNATKQRVRVVVVARYAGRVEGGKVVLRSTSRRAGPEGSEKLNDIGPADLEVSPADGKITGRMGTDADGWMTFTLPKKPD